MRRDRLSSHFLRHSSLGKLAGRFVDDRLLDVQAHDWVLRCVSRVSLLLVPQPGLSPPLLVLGGLIEQFAELEEDPAEMGSARVLAVQHFGTKGIVMGTMTLVWGRERGGLRLTR